MKKSYVAVIIVNWNGADDTIECLESILKSDYQNYRVFLIDNNSKDNSINRVLSWSEGETINIKSKLPELIYPLSPKPIKYESIELNTFNSQPLSNECTLYVIKNKENVGFAKANNIIINKILKNNLKYDYFYLLNNDTLIKPDTISNIVAHLENSDYQISNSLILNYYSTDKIDFAGGKLFSWGKAQYFRFVNAQKFRKSEFAHGCALMVKNSVFEKYGPLTEKFFHGEEDFEFSMRMKKNKQNISCCYDSRVYHKKGISIKKLLERRKQIIVFALNRLINMKSFMQKQIWILWKSFALLYIFYLLMLSKMNFFKSLKDIFNINNYVKKNDYVGINIIEKISNEVG